MQAFFLQNAFKFITLRFITKRIQIRKNGPAAIYCSQSILKWAAGGSNPAHPD